MNFGTFWNGGFLAQLNSNRWKIDKTRVSPFYEHCEYFCPESQEMKQGKQNFLFAVERYLCRTSRCEG